MGNSWTGIQRALLKELYPIHKSSELIKYFNGKTEMAIKTKAQKMGLVKVEVFFEFSNQQIERLIEIYPNTKSALIAKEFNCSITTIYNKAFDLSLKKTDDFLAKIASENFTEDHPARKFIFKKGNKSFNQGKKQVDYMTPEAIERTKATQFKPGQKVWNAKPIGYERVTVGGYIEVKVEEPNVFKAKNRIVWEKHFGPIPKGYNVQFKNGIKTDFSPENLYLISRREQLLTENSVNIIPEELKKTVNLINKLKKTIKENETNKS